MKNRLMFLLSTFAVTALMVACEKDENRVTLESGTPPVLTASSTSAMVLTSANAANTAIQFNWTNPNYRFTTGASSQDVSYTLEVDTTGANFTNPKRQQVSIAKDLSIAYTVKDFNALLNRMELVENIPHNIEFRVKASLAGGAAPVYSNVLRMRITPYLDVAVELPSSGKLFITGNATPGNWMGGGDPELTSQQFTRVNSTLYEIVVRLTADNSFLLVPVYGNWNQKYGYDGAGNNNNTSGDVFRREGNDIKAPAETANYKITVNFRTGQFTVVKQ